MAKVKEKEFSCQSPVQTDYNRQVEYDEVGNEIVSYVEVDYPKLQASLGNWQDWSLGTLMKAGINPDFPIHTGNPTRLEGLDELDAIVQSVDIMLNEQVNENNN